MTYDEIEDAVTHMLGYLDIDTYIDAYASKSVSVEDLLKIAKIQDDVYSGSMVEELEEYFSENERD